MWDSIRGLRLEFLFNTRGIQEGRVLYYFTSLSREVNEPIETCGILFGVSQLDPNCLGFECKVGWPTQVFENNIQRDTTTIVYIIN